MPYTVSLLELRIQIFGVLYSSMAFVWFTVTLLCIPISRASIVYTLHGPTPIGLAAKHAHVVQYITSNNCKIP